MTRLLTAIVSLALAACVTTYQDHELKAVPYKGHGPIFSQAQ
jgi:hypothetical protein